VGVVDQAIENGIGKGGIADDLMPGIEGQLAGHEGGAPGVAVLEDFEQIASFGVAERSETEVVQDEQLGFGKAFQLFGIRSVRASEGEIVEQTREAPVSGREPTPTGSLGQSAGEITLSGSGRARDALPINSLSESFTAGIR
jgi:hypothetical protein